MFRKAPANLRVDLREPGLGDARPSCSLAAERDAGPRGRCWLRTPPLVCLVNGCQASISGGNDVQSVKAAPKRLATRLPCGASSGGTCPGRRAQAGSVGPALAAAEGTKGAAAPPSSPCPPCPQPHRPNLCPQPPAASPLPNPADAPRPPREKGGGHGGKRSRLRGATEAEPGALGARPSTAPDGRDRAAGAAGPGGAGGAVPGGGADRGRRAPSRGPRPALPAPTAGPAPSPGGPPPSGRRGRAPAASPRGWGESAASGGAGPAAGQQQGHR